VSTPWTSAREVFQQSCLQEQQVTHFIDQLVDLSIKQNDHATHNFLQWFVSEQVEEEAAVQTILQQLDHVGTDSGALFMLDRELGQRSEAGNA
jgi:ferritin